MKQRVVKARSPKFEIRKAQDGRAASVICKYTNGRGDSTESYFVAPPPSIRHADFKYIQHRFRNVRHWKQADFIRESYEQKIKPYLRGEKEMSQVNSIRPRWMIDMDRRQEIEAAIEKIGASSSDMVPPEWKQELKEIEERETIREVKQFTDFLNDHPYSGREVLRLMQEIGDRESKGMFPSTIKNRAADVMDVYTGRVNP